MTNWQLYLDIIREEDTPLSSSSRLLTTTTTETTTPNETDAPPASLAGEHTLGVKQMGQQGQTPAQSAQSAQALPARAEPAPKARPKRALSPQPAADVAGEMAAPAADVAAPRRPASGGTSVPANWQEIDPRAYQPRPFGPMETDADWPGEDEEDDPPPPAVDAEGEAPSAGTGAPQPTPPAGTVAGATNLYPAGGTGRAAAPLSGDPFPDLEERCWLCEEEAELYDPSGQAWCSLCLETAGKSMGWQDLVALLPPAWQRREESHHHLAVFAAAHYHQAGRPKIALRWSQPPFHQTLKGADLFRAFAAWLAAPERWKQREAERLLEHLVEHQGLGVWR